MRGRSRTGGQADGRAWRARFNDHRHTETLDITCGAQPALSNHPQTLACTSTGPTAPLQRQGFLPTRCNDPYTPPARAPTNLATTTYKLAVSNGDTQHQGAYTKKLFMHSWKRETESYRNRYIWQLRSTRYNYKKKRWNPAQKSGYCITGRGGVGGRRTSGLRGDKLPS